MHRFDDKRVLVTGGTSGIGEAIADGFRNAGATVTAVGLPELDVRHEASLRGLFDRVDGLDILVNAAGVIRREEEFEMNIFEDVLNVNLTGTMRVSMAAFPHLKKTGGCVINLASIMSFLGGGHAPAYSASKGGISQLTRAMAVAWARHGIRVNAVAPGWIETPLTRPLRDDAVRSRQIVERTPMGRWGRSEEVAGPVLFLCSETASFITGAVLPIDGGYLAF